MENLDSMSRGWKPRLFVNFLKGTAVVYVVAKYPVIRETVVYTAVGLVEIIFDNN